MSATGVQTLFCVLNIICIHIFSLTKLRMDKISLEIVVISANDLKGVKNLGMSMRTYANVWTDSTTQSSTRTDRHGGSYPMWNDKFHMSVDKRFLEQKGSGVVIQIYCKTVLGKKRVGGARMPYSDIFEGYTSPESIHFMSYRVRRSNGRPRGTVDLSVRFLDKIDPRMRISRPQLELKYPSFPCRSKIEASSSSEGNNNNANYAIGIPVSRFAYAQAHQHFPAQNSEAHHHINNNTLNGYNYYGRVSAINF